MTRLYQSGWSIRPQLFFVDESSTIDRRLETDTSAVVVSRPSNTGETPEKSCARDGDNSCARHPPPPLRVVRCRDRSFGNSFMPMPLPSACSLLALCLLSERAGQSRSASLLGSCMASYEVDRPRLILNVSWLGCHPLLAPTGDRRRDGMFLLISRLCIGAG